MTICPACGVAVVPGYARCPKCHAPLPRRLTTSVEGGTALEGTRSKAPLAGIVAAGVIGLGVILWLGVRHHGGDTASAQPAPVAAQPANVAAPQPAIAPVVADTSSAPRRPPPATIAADLQRALGKQRLWSTVTVTGGRVDVRSDSCSDQAIQAPIAAALPSFKASGLTTLRCVEQSGAVVFTREL